MVDPSDIEIHSVVQGDLKITDRLCHKRIISIHYYRAYSHITVFQMEF
jgi:hypothetical protein